MSESLLMVKNSMGQVLGKLLAVTKMKIASTGVNARSGKMNDPSTRVMLVVKTKITRAHKSCSWCFQRTSRSATVLTSNDWSDVSIFQWRFRWRFALDDQDVLRAIYNSPHQHRGAGSNSRKICGG